jgi:hypothetical protein
VEADAIKGPGFIVVNDDGQRFVEPDALVHSTATLRLSRAISGYLRSGEVIDARGNRYFIRDTSLQGIAWKSHFSGGLFLGVLSLILGFLFLSVLVKVRLTLDLDDSFQPVDWKEYLIKIVSEQPNKYRHSLFDELVKKINSASSIKALVSRWYA